MPAIKETCLVLLRGYTLRFPNAQEDPTGVEYVRFADETGQEVAYWDSQEWRDAPQEVMGAILGFLAGKFPGQLASGTLETEGEE